MPNVPIPLPHIPGSDVAGDIAKIGADVTTIRVGQRVVLAPLVSCGKCPACLAGLDNHCRQASNLGGDQLLSRQYRPLARQNWQALARRNRQAADPVRPTRRPGGFWPAACLMDPASRSPGFRLTALPRWS